MEKIDTRKLTELEKQEQFEKVLDRVIENRKDQPPGTFGEIDLTFLETLTEPVQGEEDVLKRNDQLTEHHKGVVAMYGFEDYYSLYLFAKSVTQKNNLGLVGEGEDIAKADSGGKDFSKLSKVRRTVIRNGKPTKMTFYQDTKGIDNKFKTRGGSSQAKQTVSNAKELKIIAVGDPENPIPTEELHAAKQISEDMIEILPDFDDVFRIKLYLDDQLIPQALQGLREEGEFITTSYLARTEQTHDIYPRAFYETIKVAMNLERGVAFAQDELEIQHALAESIDMKERNGMYQATYEELVDAFGGALP